MTVRCESV